jgi:radical SAM superfamily enzyme YgiQ (UPF0313 family)
MRITFIRPNLWEVRSADAMQPLVFAILSALTPSDHQISFYDERLESIDFEHDTDLVAITAETYTAKRSYEISHRFRKRDIPVVMGGYHPTLMPDEARLYADAIVIGDAEGLWWQILEDAKNDCLKPIYSQAKDPALGGVIPDRDIFKGKKYNWVIPVHYGRGCRFACDFCSIYSFYKARLRQRPLNEMISEIEQLNSRNIFFVDDNLFINKTVTKEFLKAIKPLNIDWGCQISIDVVKDLELVDLMADSGCFVSHIGLESLNRDNLAQMNKRWNLKYGDYGVLIKQIHDRGIMVYASFVMGYDQDTLDSFEIIVDFALENKLYLASFNPLTPMPGTRLYERFKKEERLTYDRWWLDPNYKYGEAVFYPKGMTPEELAEGCYWARTEFNKYASIFKRALDSNANARNLKNLGVYLLSNLISRKEIHKKQGHALGNIRDPISFVEESRNSL